MLNIKSMKQPFKSLYSEEGHKQFLHNAGHTVRHCLPWQFKRLYCIPVPTGSMTSPSLEKGRCPFLEF
jgi:hypothetical protein